MSSIITNIACTSYYQITLSFGISCTAACESPFVETYYTNCSPLNTGCQILDSNGTDAPLGYYSDGTYCYEFAVSGELSVVTNKSACLSERCACFGYSVTSCAEAQTNFGSC